MTNKVNILITILISFFRVMIGAIFEDVYDIALLTAASRETVGLSVIGIGWSDLWSRETVGLSVISPLIGSDWQW